MASDAVQAETTGTSSNLAPPKWPTGRWYRVRIQLGRLLVIGLVLLSWDLCVHWGAVSRLFASSPTAVFNLFISMIQTNTFWLNVKVTTIETFLGFAIGSSAGIAAGLVLARFEWLFGVLDPLMTFLNALPRVALAPLFLLWFGIGSESKVALAVSLVFFILATSTRAGVKSVDPDMVVAVRLLGAKSRQVLTKVILPSAVPAIFGGIRLATVYALLGVVFGEILAAQHGVGEQLSAYEGTFNTTGVLALVFVLGIMGAGLNAATGIAERRLLRWQDKG